MSGDLAIENARGKKVVYFEKITRNDVGFIRERRRRKENSAAQTGSISSKSGVFYFF
jgi:hypothetical protein